MRFLHLQSFLFLHFLCTGQLFVRQVFIEIFELLQKHRVVFHLSLKFLDYFGDSDKNKSKIIME